MMMPDVGRSTDRFPPAYRLYRLVWAGLDLVYPPHCSGCDKPGWRWCAECYQNVRNVLPPLCDCCGQSLLSGGLCPTCQDRLPTYTALRSWGYFSGPLRRALHRLKYKGDIALSEILARPLVTVLQETNWKIDLVTVVPLGVARMAQRGYNQASLLAWPLALSCRLKYSSKALSKLRETRSQVGLNISQRHANVAGAFHAEHSIVFGQSVLVVDDVVTSGATMQACAQALLTAGARQVFGLTLARAVHPPKDSI
jgi:competence protein ComFC